MIRAVTCVLNDNAPWIMLIHGFGGSSNTWKKQIPDLNRQFNLLLVDMHPNGKTGTSADPDDRKTLTVEKVCRELEGILNAHRIDKVAVLTISSGSLVGLAFTALYPHRVSGMIHGGGILRFRFHTLILLWCARILRFAVPYMALYRFFAWVIMPGRDHAKSRHIFIREAKTMKPFEFRRWVRFLFPLKDNARYIEALNRYVPTIPALYIMGEKDRLFLPAIKKDVLLLNGATILVLPDCGHVCSIEQDGLFNRAVQDFLHGVSV